jgi:hypothetical protein
MEKTHDGLEKVLDAMQASEEHWWWVQSLPSAIIELYDAVKESIGKGDRATSARASLNRKEDLGILLAWAGGRRTAAERTLRDAAVALSAKRPAVYLP